MESLLDYDVAVLLDLLAQPGSAPAAGSAAALVTAAAAALLAKVARSSGAEWDGAEAASAQAESLRARVLPLAQADAHAYAAAVERLAGRAGAPSEQSDFQLGRALDDAAEVPLRIADAAADVTELAALVAAHGRADVQADAVVAAILAEASTRAAAHLVGVNLAVGAEHERAHRARAATAAAASALEGATSAASGL